ncbi:hypothetical protein FH972_015079 [Carpinus fangiana]|uniref:Uncharacterized protein n=1 Tax=Carpinus fangiana TaxID=176857 RepID=A0A5N6RCP1_9ROSI|nr:hypothetical protein FH972_015079 [Carpinus fangiana]
MAPPTSSKSNKSTPISSARAWTNVVTLWPSLYACLLSSTSRFTLTLALCSNRSTTQTLVILVTRHGQATWAIAERVEQRGRVDKLGRLGKHGAGFVRVSAIERGSRGIGSPWSLWRDP